MVQRYHALLYRSPSRTSRIASRNGRTVGDKSRCTPILAKPCQGVQRLLSPTLGLLEAQTATLKPKLANMLRYHILSGPADSLTNFFGVWSSKSPSQTEIMAIHRLRASFIHICLLLTTLIHTAAAIPFCTALYGTPDHESCDQLLYGDLSRGYRGLGNRDYRTHLFALPLTWRPLHITDEQWNNKVNLPIIRSNRKPIHSITTSQTGTKNTSSAEAQLF